MKPLKKNYWLIGGIAVVAAVLIAVAYTLRTPSYKTKNGKPQPVLAHYGDTPVEQFLEIADDAHDLPHLPLTYHYKSNPAADWAINRMLQMYYPEVTGADSLWAWKGAVDETVAAYERCKKLPVCDKHPMALIWMDSFADKLGSDAPLDDATYNYYGAVTTLYLTLDHYTQLIDSAQDSSLKQLLYQEYAAWEAYRECEWKCRKPYDAVTTSESEACEYLTARLESFAKSIKRDYDILIQHQAYNADILYSLDELYAQVDEVRQAADSTQALLPRCFDQWLAARNEVNSALQGEQAASYGEATRDIIDAYLRPRTLFVP
jgi:hypothetical protein